SHVGCATYGRGPAEARRLRRTHQPADERRDPRSDHRVPGPPSRGVTQRPPPLQFDGQVAPRISSCPSASASECGSQSEGRTVGADSAGSGARDGGRRGLPGGRRHSRTTPQPTTGPTPAPTPTQGATHDRNYWTDCETTAPDTTNDALVEIPALVTDSELNILGEGVDIVIHAPDAKLEAMVPVVREMHANSGLTDELRSSSVTVAEAEKAV